MKVAITRYPPGGEVTVWMDVTRVLWVHKDGRWHVEVGVQ